MASTDSKPTEPEKVWYDAACHCKAVQFKALLPRSKIFVCRCNCSVCQKLGYLLVYPRKEEVEWIQGFDKLSTYKFGPKVQEHKFCSSCGTSLGIDSMGMGKVDVWRLNVRLFRGIDLNDLEKLNYHDFDGKAEMYPEFNED